MLFYKLVGSICIISACVLIGFMQNIKFQNYVICLRNIYHILYMIRGEILYTRSPLGEVFGVLAGRVKQPYHSWLLSLEKNINQKDGDFQLIWKKSLDKYLGDLKFKPSHKHLINEFGSQLGRLDYQTDLGNIEWYLDELKSEIEKEKKELITKKKLCNCLGIMAGLFLVIILI